jgi:hypothetical protein
MLKCEDGGRESILGFWGMAPCSLPARMTDPTRRGRESVLSSFENLTYPSSRLHVDSSSPPCQKHQTNVPGNPPSNATNYFYIQTEVMF